MGEKIKTLSKGEIFGRMVEIELNKPNHPSQARDIHIQSDHFRLQMDEKDYVKMAVTLLSGKMRLIKMKQFDEK